MKLNAIVVGKSLAENAAPLFRELGCPFETAASLEEAEARLHSEAFAIFAAEESLLPAILKATERGYPLHFLGGSPIDRRDLATTLSKLRSGDIFGMERYEIAVQEKAELKEDDSRYPQVDRMKDFFREQGIAERILDKVELTLHELLMNAARLKAEDPRPSPAIGLAYGISADSLAVAVRDPFGRLDPAALFGAIRRAAVEKSVVDEPGRGAGLGLFLSLKASANLIVNVAPGTLTEVIALFHRAKSQGEAAQMGHSFHYFQELKP